MEKNRWEMIVLFKKKKKAAYIPFTESLMKSHKAYIMNEKCKENVEQREREHLA